MAARRAKEANPDKVNKEREREKRRVRSAYASLINLMSVCGFSKESIDKVKADAAILFAPTFDDLADFAVNETETEAEVDATEAKPPKKLSVN